MLFITIVYFFINILQKWKETQKDIQYKINYYVIYLEREDTRERYENVKMLAKTLEPVVLNIYPAIDILKLNMEKDVKKKYDFHFKYRQIGEVGCYLSHLELIKQLMNTPDIDKKGQFTVIFEDDAHIDNPPIQPNIEKILKVLENMNVDFDILFLGNFINKGKQLKDNIYYVDNNNYLWGTYGYLINNSKLGKIYNGITKIDMPIDVKYKKLIDNNQLTAFIIDPVLVSMDKTLKSTIRD